MSSDGQTGTSSATTAWVATPAADGSPPSLAVTITTSAGSQSHPFFARGVAYSPVPWGADSNWPPYGDFMFPPWNGVWERDLPLMRGCGVNVVRTYNIQNVAPGSSPPQKQDHIPFFDACWNDGTDPVYVLVGFGPLNSIAMYDPWDQGEAAREQAKTDFLAMVSAYADCPAVMGFIIGNEVNSIDTIGKSKFWAWLNDLAEATKTAAPGKLTLLALVDDSMTSVEKGDATMTHLDVWGINSYRGAISPANANNFNNLWSTFSQNSKKPLLISEWGAPASTHETDAKGNVKLAFTNQVAVDLNTYISGHYNDILFNRVSTSGDGGKSNPNSANWAAVCVGSCYFEWTDEWWKLDDDYPDETCPATVQNPGIATNAAFPGGYDDEECFGLNAIEPSGTNPEKRPGPNGGGCPGPWDFAKSKPYPADKLLPRVSLVTLRQLFML